MFKIFQRIIGAFLAWVFITWALIFYISLIVAFLSPIFAANQTRTQLQNQINVVPWTNGMRLITGLQLQNIYQNFLDSFFVTPNVNLLTCTNTACTLSGDYTVTGAFTANGTVAGTGFAKFAIGPGAATIGNVACWNNTSGSLLEDCGPPVVSPKVLQFDTRASAVAATISSLTTSVRTSGYTTVGDGGNALYYKIGVLTSCGFQSADGAFWALVNETQVSVFQCGATGNGSTDDTTAIQAAISLVSTAGGGTVYIPKGTFKISSALSVTAGMIIHGDGKAGTTIQLASTTQDGFSINATSAVHIADMRIIGTNSGGLSTATAGSLIKITGASNNLSSSIRGVDFIFGFVTIDFATAQNWVVDNIWMTQGASNGTGIFIDNTTTPFSGELSISNALIEGPLGGGTSTGISQLSSVNLKITNSEIFEWENGYLFDAASAFTGGGTFISNTVFSQVDNVINLVRSTAGATFAILVVTNSEIIGKFPISSDANPGWLSDVIITGNFINCGDGNTAGAGTCINLPQTNNFTITGNLIVGTGTGNNGIVIGSGSSNGTITGNVTLNAAAISNGSATTTLTGNR